MRSHAKASSAGSVWIAGAAALILSLVFLAMTSAPAFAALGHSVLRTFSTGPGTNPQAIALDGSDNVYVTELGTQQVAKFDSTGNPSSFGGSAPYIKGNTLTGSPQGPLFFFSFIPSGLAVDHSGGPADGNIYVAALGDEGRAYVFSSTGAFEGPLGGAGGLPCGIAVDQNSGSVYVGDFSESIVRRFAAPGANPAEAATTGELHRPGCSMAIDSSGETWVGTASASKYAASQFEVASPVAGVEFPVGSYYTAVATDPANDDLYLDEGNQIVEHNSAGTQLGTPFGTALTESGGVAVGSGGDVYATDNGGGVFVFGPDQVELPLAATGGPTNVAQNSADLEGNADPDGAGAITGCEFRYGLDTGYSAGSVPCSQSTPISSATAVTAHLTGLTAGTAYHYRLFLTNANGTQIGADQTFTTPSAVEGLTTGPASEVAKDSASLNGSYVGDGQDTHYYFEWGTTPEYGQTAPAAPGDDAGSASGPQNVAPIHLTGLHADTTYHFRLVASNTYGSTRGQDEAFTTPTAVTGLTADPPSAITDTSANLNASFDGDGTYETHYYFEWGPTTAYGNVTPAPPGAAIPATTGRITVPPVGISGLQSGYTYHYRVVASNTTGTTASADASFNTAEAPQISNLNSRNLQATSGELLGEINPRHGDTTYRFEWGPTAAYGNRSPAVDASAGSGSSPIPVSTQLTGLTAGVTYHFRLVATNQYGTTSSVDQTFGFYPPNCPNAQLRQETQSGALPDCRAYELVTPSYAQGALVLPLGGPPAPLATSPSRIAYTVGYGTFAEEAGDPSNVTGDLTVSTRTDNGWYQRYVGEKATETLVTGGPPRNYVENFNQSQWGSARQQLGSQASPQLDRAINYDQGWPDVSGQYGHPSNAPYVWDTSTGNQLARWPTNLSQVENGEKFVGIPEASPDFSHFVFQSNLVFAPGGTEVERSIGCCDTFIYPQVPPASIYDNDLTTGTVKLASIKGGAEDETFEGYVYNISEDGSRIVMAEERSTPATVFLPPGVNALTDIKGPLYVRVEGRRTFEIAKGHDITYIGSTADGRTIYLSSTEALNSEATGGGRGLYAWHESEPSSLKLISLGEHGESGSIEAIDFSRYSGTLVKGETFRAGQGGNGVSDSAIASQSGDIYFISPEQLLEGKGEPGQANLYLYRKGTLRFVVSMNPQPACTTLEISSGCATGPVARMDVTPDGAHMAFVTQSKVTGYDNNGKTEMYTYEPETGRITCASCRPDGQAPASEVLASQNGLFQTYDGRVFFSTEDPLVPRDTDGVGDVYEYTEGRPQLITSGIGAELKGHFNGAMGEAFLSGLVSVSANGTDVYFATSGSLVSQDHNGSATLKIYDARTGGGFPAERTPADCTAADECHGPGNAQPALPPDRTSANLGKTAKPKTHEAKKHQKRKAHKKKHRKAKKKAKGPRANGKQGRG